MQTSLFFFFFFFLSDELLWGKFIVGANQRDKTFPALKLADTCQCYKSGVFLFLQVLMNSLSLFWKANRHRKCMLKFQHLDFRALSVVKLLNSAAGQVAVQNEVSLVSLNRECVENRTTCKHQARTMTVTGKKRGVVVELKQGDLIAKYNNDL